LGRGLLRGLLCWSLLGHCLLRRSLLCRSFLRCCLLGGRLLCCFLNGQRSTSSCEFAGALLDRSFLGCCLSALHASSAFSCGGLRCGLFGHSFFRDCLLDCCFLGRSLL